MAQPFSEEVYRNFIDRDWYPFNGNITCPVCHWKLFISMDKVMFIPNQGWKNITVAGKPYRLWPSSNNKIFWWETTCGGCGREWVFIENDRPLLNKTYLGCKEVQSCSYNILGEQM
jgi:hypothetical protein